MTGAVRAAALVFGALVALSAGPARAQEGPPGGEGGPVIPPGREPEVLGLVKAATADADLTEPWDVSIEQRAFRVTLRDGRSFLVGAPGAEPPLDATPIGEGVALRCAPACRPEQLEASRALGAALARRRDPIAGRLWEAPRRAPAVGPPGLDPQRDPAAPPPVAMLHPARVAFYGGALVGALAALGRWRPRRPTGWQLALLGVVAASAGLSLGGAWGTLHEHNTFAPRLDCAYALDCTTDPRGPGWSAPFFLVYGPLLHLGAYTLEAPVRLSLACAWLTLLLLHALVRDLLAPHASARFAELAGLGAAALLGLNPVSARLAAADSPWPFVMACLLGAALLARVALRRGSPWLGLAAGALLVPVLGGNLTLLALWPAVMVAPLVWARRVTGRGALAYAAALAVPLALTAPDAAATLARVQALGTTLDRIGAVPSFLPLELEFIPAPFAVALLGLAPWGYARWRAEGHRGALRALAPLGLLLAPHLSLHDYAAAASFPVGVLNHHLGVVVAAALAGPGFAWATRRVLALGRPATAAAAALTVATWAAATEGWELWRRHQVPSAEAAALAQVLARLPPHRLLVLGSAVQPPLVPHPATQNDDGDPIEINYPLGVHVATLARRGEPAPRVLTIPEFLERRPAARALVYVGSSLRSFKPGEIAAGVVPDGLARPELARLREAYRLDPAVTFELPTAQSRRVTMRLGADRAPTVELGYYWATPR